MKLGQNSNKEEKIAGKMLLEYMNRFRPLGIWRCEQQWLPSIGN